MVPEMADPVCEIGFGCTNSEELIYERRCKACGSPGSPCCWDRWQGYHCSGEARCTGEAGGAVLTRVCLSSECLNDDNHVLVVSNIVYNHHDGVKLWLPSLPCTRFGLWRLIGLGVLQWTRCAHRCPPHSSWPGTSGHGLGEDYARSERLNLRRLSFTTAWKASWNPRNARCLGSSSVVVL